MTSLIVIVLSVIFGAWFFEVEKEMSEVEKKIQVKSNPQVALFIFSPF